MLLGYVAFSLFQKTPLRFDVLQSQILQTVGSSQQVQVLSMVAITTELIFVLAFAVVGVFIFFNKPCDGWVIFFSSAIITLGLDQSHIDKVTSNPLLTVYTMVCIVTLWYLFPNGRFTPRWTVVPVSLWIVMTVYWFFTPQAWMNPIYTDTTKSVPVALFVLITSVCSIGLWSQVYRYRFASPIERQQTKWVLVGFCFIFTGAVLQYFPVFNVPSASPMGVLLRMPVSIVLSIVWPVTVAFAVFQYRLWDADIVLNRTLVYGLLIASLSVLYILILTLMSAVLRITFLESETLPGALVATAAVTIAFQPLRDRIQRAINRLMFGERDDPYKVMRTLSHDLQLTADLRSMLPRLIEEIVRSLKLSSAAAIATQAGKRIVLARFPEDTPIAADGGAPWETIDLIYQNTQIGELLLGRRRKGEPLTPKDINLLNDIAPLLGATIHNIFLTSDLQRALEKEVLAREEERRQIRNDLHDDLGPKLAILRLQIDNTASEIRSDPENAEALMAVLSDLVKDALQDVRTIVRSLRPPELDDLGLVEALRVSIGHHPEMAITVSAEGPLPALPAAVESTAFRITQEAILNSIRHSGAQACRVRITADAAQLGITIEDNGRGFNSKERIGIGLRSMRERAERLGGAFAVTSSEGQGTRIVASLPIRSTFPDEEPIP